MSMNSRNRIIYNVLALYAGQNDPITGVHSGNGIKQLTRVQNFDEDFSRTFTNIEQFGNLAAIDRIEMEAPTVKAGFSYYLSDGSNEAYLGLLVSTGSQSLASAISGYLTEATDTRNMFLAISDEGHDAADSSYAGNTGVIGIGNAFLTSYDVEASVGAIPKATVQMEALNMAIYATANGTNNVPAVTPTNGFPVTGNQFLLPLGVTNANTSQPTALQPGDITLNITGLVGISINDLKIQSFKMSLPLSRDPIRKLGSRFAYTRQIKWPVTAKFSIDAELGALDSVNDGGSSQGSYSGNLANVLCDTGVNTMSVVLHRPLCQGTGSQALIYQFRGAKLMSQKINTSIGSDAKITAEYEAQIGAAEDVLHGLFISGSYPYL